MDRAVSNATGLPVVAASPGAPPAPSCACVPLVKQPHFSTPLAAVFICFFVPIPPEPGSYVFRRFFLLLFSCERPSRIKLDRARASMSSANLMANLPCHWLLAAHAVHFETHTFHSKWRNKKQNNGGRKSDATGKRPPPVFFFSLKRYFYVYA